MMETPSLYQAVKNAAKSFLAITPMLLGVVLMIGLFDTLVSEAALRSVFSGNPLYDTLIGAAAGSISVGQPVASYVIGGELRDSGVSMYAVSAFIVSWVTIGVVQLPLEARLFGLRFMVQRNILAFIFALIIAAASVETLRLFS